MTTNTTTTSLADAYVAAFGAAELAHDDPEADTDALDEAVEAARTAWLDSDEVREWEFAVEGHWEAGHHHAPSEVKEALKAWAGEGWERDRTIWVRGRAQPIDPTTGDAVEDDDYEIAVRVTLNPEEPECTSTEHDWQSPHSVLGGLRENPGVWGHGGGVFYREVCAHCGRYRVTDTWAQDPDTGEQGLTSVAYEDADADSIEWIENRRRREA